MLLHILRVNIGFPDFHTGIFLLQMLNILEGLNTFVTRWFSSNLQRTRVRARGKLGEPLELVMTLCTNIWKELGKWKRKLRLSHTLFLQQMSAGDLISVLYCQSAKKWILFFTGCWHAMKPGFCTTMMNGRAIGSTEMRLPQVYQTFAHIPDVIYSLSGGVFMGLFIINYLRREQ